VQLKDITAKMKKKILDNGEDLYKHVKGRARSDNEIIAHLERVRLGSPALRLVCKQRHNDERNVFFGVAPTATAFQQIMAVGGRCQQPNPV
jgi:hypothetical protein